MKLMFRLFVTGAMNEGRAYILSRYAGREAWKKRQASCSVLTMMLDIGR